MKAKSIRHGRPENRSEGSCAGPRAERRCSKSAFLTPKRLAAVWLLAASLFPAGLLAQNPPTKPTTPAPTPPPMRPPELAGYQLVVRVREVNGPPLSVFALVRLSSRSGAINLSSSTSGDARATFQGLAPGDYTVEVMAPGYQTMQEEVTVWHSGVNDVIVYVKPESPFKTPPPGAPVLAPKALKATEKGLAALRANRLDEARKQLKVALQLAPGHPDVNFLAGVLWMQLNDLPRSRALLEKTTQLDPTHRFAWIALGEVSLRLGDWSEAVANLSKALEVEPNSWRGHWLKANAHLRRREFALARFHAEQALVLGKEKARPCRLLLGEALAGLGQREQAIAVLEAFLRELPQHPAANDARSLLSLLRRPVRQDQGITLASTRGETSRPAPEALPAPEPPLPEPGWAPHDIDNAVPPVDPNTLCSLPDVVQGASRQVKRLVENLERFAATERLDHQEYGPSGNPGRRDVLSFHYLVSISEVRPGWLAVEEMREQAGVSSPPPAGLLTMGLAALALVFHPYYVDDFQMSCEGLGQWRGNPAWQVHFVQRRDRPSRIAGFHSGAGNFPLPLKGRAWIAADTHQVVRLETDLTEPVPPISLQRQHQTIEYAPVWFRARQFELWLPKSAEIYLDFRGRHHHRRLSYSDYELFSVDVMQKISNPKEP